jgi:hypothetical protein
MTEPTRRDWLITISAVATGAGLAERMKGDSGYTGVLPAGVYEPSSDHLSHALMSAGRYHAIPPDCPTEYVRPRTGSFEPQFFSTPQFEVIRRIVMVILGENSSEFEGLEETAEWIDLVVSESDAVRRAAAQIDSLHRKLAEAYYGGARAHRLATENPAKTCRDGLEWLDGRAKDFASLAHADQVALVQAMSEEKPETPGGRFFSFLKTETIKGFYTSRQGLKELDYKGNAFYARSPGCSV